MNTGEAEPSSGLNGRLRPRKSNIPSPKAAKNTRKPDTKPAPDKPKRTITPSKASSNKPDDLTPKADSPDTQTLCPYCDKTFFAHQALSKHVHRLHLPNSKQDSTIKCIFCTHVEKDANDIIRHMVDNHPNQYFACYDCHTRFPSTSELAEHKLNVCEKEKVPYRNKLRQKETLRKSININGRNEFGDDVKDFPNEHGFNGMVISCELKSSHGHDLADIEDSITTNFILPPGKNLLNGTVIEKNAVIILNDLQWNKRVPPNFSFQTADADQILSRLGVVHRSPRTGESNCREWLKNNDESHQKFEKCFDTSFYSKVASNVQENLSKFLDGSCNFNPDPENTIKTRKAKNIVAINTVEGFPILLACEQFSRNGFDGYMPRAIAPKHKWKWDNLDNDKGLMSPEHMKRDSHTNNCIISLVSSLDIWTQLCMRRKFEVIFSKTPVQKKTERRSIIGKELKEILESRELPRTSSQVVKYTGPTAPSRPSAEFPASLGLVPTTPSFDLKPAVLSGEWVRPRCYVCCACGAQTRDSKALSSHISMRHPNAQIQHYEIVGEVLLNSDILKHLYVPPKQMNNRTRPLRGFRDCTKCKTSISLEDLHQHMLNCAGDTPAVRRKCRYRPFGVRKRRPRLPDNTISKNIRKDIRTRHGRKSHMRPRPRRRTEVGDAETIRKMLADLPAKRHRVVVKPLNPTIRPRRNLKNPRNKLVMKKRIIEETKKTLDVSLTQASTASKGAEGSKMSLNDLNNRPHLRPFKPAVNRVASKILRKKDSFTKNNVNKSKRKIGMRKAKPVNVHSAVEMPLADNGKDNIQIDQLSIENNPERINLNDGSNNARRHGDRSNNNSNDRDNQSPDANNGQGNNSRDAFAPLQNAPPLKHSIASLTASSETHDKSVQFHHLFLIQQECNNVNQHLTAEQRMLFENEAVVTKLDKPPLHFNNRRPVDLQALQKNKLNKPRKGLNDCIAMLRNKLVEPNTSISPGHVSVQCGDDEPLDPEPMIVERRHSTNELNTNYAQTPDYHNAHVPKNASEDNVQNVTSKSSTTEKSSPTRQGYGSLSDKTAEMLSYADFIKWGQFCYGPQMIAAQNFTENYNRRESRRRNSLVSMDELLLQQAINFELLSQSNELSKFVNYHHYPSVSAQLTQPIHPTQPNQSTYNQPKKNNRRVTQKSKATTNVPSPRSKSKPNGSTQGKNFEESISTNMKQSNCSKSNVNYISTNINSDKQHGQSTQLTTATATIDKNIGIYPRVVVTESATLNKEKLTLPVNKPPPEYHSPNVSSSKPHSNVYGNNGISPVQNIIHNNVVADNSGPNVVAKKSGPAVIAESSGPKVVAENSGPLDLSNKIMDKEDSVPYTAQKQLSEAAHNKYLTLDLSNKNLGNLIARDRNIGRASNVDLPINYGFQDRSRYTTLPSELINDEVVTVNATDLSLRRDGGFSSNLSVSRRDYSSPSPSFENTTEGHRLLPLKYRRDLSHPMRHADGRCFRMQEYYDPNTNRIIVIEKEMPADLPVIRSDSRLDMCVMEEPMHLYSNNEPNDENVPKKIIGKSGPPMESTSTRNNNVRHDDNYDAQQASHDPIINFHYDRPIQTPSETNFARCHQTPNIYCEPTQHFETVSNTALAPVSRAISINETSVQKSANYEQIHHSQADMPFNSVSNSVIEGICYKYSQNPIIIVTDYDELTTCTVANDIMSVAKTDPTYTSATLLTNVNAVNTNMEKITETTSSETERLKSTETYKTLLSSEEKTSESNKLSVSNTCTPTTNITTMGVDKRKVETVSVSNCNATNLDQDHETARKIAMLPKELVEILGTMPVDHRNQLLNVLPQYVSTSTSPVSHSNIDESVRCVSDSSSGSLLTITNTNDEVSKEFKLETNSEDGRMSNTVSTCSKNYKFPESSTISVSSSILLTPTTPQLSERYLKKSQPSEERMPSKCVDFNTLNAGSNILAVKRLTNTVEYNDPHKVIDLTVDENSSGNADVTNLESVIPTHMLTVSTKDISPIQVISKSKVAKTSNDQTASLRAVRIKTPSERHRSMLAENKMVKLQNESPLSIDVQHETNKDFDNISPMAIQQADVSSTQHRLVLKASQTHIKSSTEEKMAEEKALVNIGDDKAPLLHEKSNLVTSCKDCPAITCEDKNNKTLVNTENISFSKIHNSISNINDKISNNYEISMKENVTEKQSSSINPKESSMIEDDDSEDDVTLAVIVKQKNRDSNSNLETQNITKIGMQSKQLPGNKKKRKSKINNKSVELIYDKSSLEDKPEFKNPPTGTISEITTNKDRVCNESNLIDSMTYGKKNARKGRLLNIAQTVEFSDGKDQTIATIDYENEINKENNVSSDIGKIMESSEDSFKLKSIDQDPNRPTSYAIGNSDNTNKDSPNPPGKKDKGKKIVFINTECGSSISEISETYKDENSNQKQNETGNNLPTSSLNLSSIEQCHPQPHSGTESETICANVIENPNEIIKCKNVNKNINLNILQKPEGVSGEKSSKIKKVSIEFCPATNINLATNINTELEENNVTPLRRSRRGKSLYIDSNTTKPNNPVVRDIVSEQRTPLTKKQLIFSKLLLDEAKLKNISSNNTPNLIEENINKISLNSIPILDEENINKILLNSIPSLNEENLDIRTLNTVEENIQKKACVTMPIAAEENFDEIPLNTIPNIVEVNIHGIPVNNMPNNSEEKEENLKIACRNISSTMPHAVDNNIYKTTTQTTKTQIIEESLLKTSLNITPSVVKENQNTSSDTIPHIAEASAHKNSFNMIPNIIEDNLKNPLNTLLNEEKQNTPDMSSNTSKLQEHQIEPEPMFSSKCSVSIVDEESEKFQTNKRKIPSFSKRKSKKKKSLSNQTKSQETNEELYRKLNTENKESQSETTNKIILLRDSMVSEILPREEKDLAEPDRQEMSNVIVNCVDNSTDFDYKNTSPKLLSIEKRKSCSPLRHDFLPSSKPKKCKLNDESENTVVGSVIKEGEKDNIELKVSENKNVVAPRITTCYNKPARRARSKSVVVKSSGSEFYDPYDIDLEDMADKTEPFDRKEIHAKISFSSFKSIAAKTRNLSKTAPSAIIDISPTESSELAVPSTSATKEAPVSNNDKINNINNIKIDCNENALSIKYGSSDSDESTKSDEPLKKYADKKEKTLAEMSLTMDHNKTSGDNINDSNDKFENSRAPQKHSESILTNTKEDNLASDKIDNEKDRRSEQFMESFGFFSERKPRKSNLLATKKISETFHSIANESEDVYVTTKERSGKKGTADNRKEDSRYSKGCSGSPSKRREAARRGRKKKSCTPNELRFCTVCKKSFRRSDNLLRHQLTLNHAYRLCGIEQKSETIEEEPNYLIALREQLENLIFLQDKVAKRKKNSLPTYDIILPTFQEIIADVKRTIREQKLSRRKLSRDEALFLDCCEMLKHSHKTAIPENNRFRQCNSFNCPQTCEDQLAFETCSPGAKCETKCDEDMDSNAAKIIFESDEVRNLENDLISNLKEASGLKGFANFRIKSSDELKEKRLPATVTSSNYQRDGNIGDPVRTKCAKHAEVKDKMYPDINDTIDMFEDKFDKIKRKCRSQAAAAKQIQIQVDPNLSNKTRKKSERKKVKKSSKKIQNVVPTKGALKGFDGIKVSILTSDINMSAIGPSVGSSFKKSRKNNKKKRERQCSEISIESVSDQVAKESSQKKVDVYEFLDTEDTELFEFRPSTLMERFKIFNKELPCTSKTHVNELSHTSTDSVSDGDDFVYMDELAFSEEETENSVLSCELGCVKGNNETKRSSPLKRKDVIEKNAVMGKIFKHNAVRSEKKITKQSVKSKANLDQLFDSLLEKEPQEQTNEETSPQESTSSASTYCRISPQRKDTVQSRHNDLPPVVLSRKPEPSMSVTPFEELISQRNAAVYKYESSKDYTQSHQVLKFDTSFNKYRKVDVADDDYKSKYNDSSHTRDVDCTFTEHKSKEKLYADKYLSNTQRKINEETLATFRVESPEEEISYEDGGVARQRARRKCTVGKQNVLAETWSSESEPDAAPPRPNSAESVIAAHARKRKPRKREGRETGLRRAAARRPEAGRSRWSEGEGDEGPEIPQQHGWIVGDSHKKLVTMLAHAKGRKRSGDDQRQVLE